MVRVFGIGGYNRGYRHRYDLINTRDELPLDNGTIFLPVLAVLNSATFEIAAAAMN